MTTTMRAAVCVGPGGPDVLEIRDVPVPALREGWSLVQVKAAGLNRSELRTRQGHSPSVTFPRVLGIECVGVVAASIASGHGIETAATTRRQSKIEALTAAGVDHVLLDHGGSLAASVRALW